MAITENVPTESGRKQDDDQKSSCEYKYQRGNQICDRETWKGTDRCVWHADEEEKSVEVLEKYRQESPERLDGAVLRGVSIQGEISFDKCQLNNSDFRDSNLKSVSFEQTTLRDSDFSNSKLENVHFGGADFTKINFSDVQFSNMEFNEVDLRRADFSRSDLENESFEGSLLMGANFRGTNLKNTNFRGSNLHKADITGANLSEANLEQADLARADLYGARLTGANLQEANLHNTNLANTFLSGAKLSGARLKKTTFRRSNIEDATLPLNTIIDSTSEQTITSLKCSQDRSEIDSLEISEFFSYLSDVYGLLIHNQENLQDYLLTDSLELEKKRSEIIANSMVESKRNSDTNKRTQGPMLQEIKKESPIEMVLAGTGLCLILSLILCGGSMKLSATPPQISFKINSLGSGIEKLAEAYESIENIKSNNNSEDNSN